LTSRDWVQVQAPREGATVVEPIPLMADAIYTWAQPTEEGHSQVAAVSTLQHNNLFHLKCKPGSPHAIYIS
jgi:hypothetical protein